MMKEKNYKMGLKKILTIVILCTIQVFKSQLYPVNPGISNNSIPNIVSPEVNTLLRYDDFPDVGFIGGTDINIPIYEIKYDGLTIPISLSYNTKGAKVADIASSVGLGWTLNAGGSITMEANERYDFSGSFKKSVTGQISPITQTLMAGCGLYGEYYLAGGNPVGSANFIIDAAPDYYHVSSPGLNDKFYLSKMNGEFEMKSLQNLKTRFLENIKEPQDFDIFRTFIDYGGEVSYIIKKFNIKNDNGFLYNFQNRIISRSPYSIPTNDIATPSSWLLSSIQSPQRDNKVEFLYENFSNNYVHHSVSVYQRVNTGSIDISKIINSTPPPANPELSADQLGKANWGKTRFENSQRLKTITFPEGSINFIYGASRLDYDGQVLSKIVIKDLSGKEIKYIDFTYSYFQSNDSNCSGVYNCLRLKLDQVYDSTLQNSYILSYGGQNPSDNLFPPRGSGKVDFLGYYKNNGSDVDLGCNSNCYYSIGWGSQFNNTTNLLKTNKIYFYPNLIRDYFIPFELSNYNEESTTGVYDGSASSQSLLGLLTSIRYPTKGGLKIEYENDDFEYLGVNYILGSARIKSMEYFDNLNSSLRKINYLYKNADLKSTGQICFLIPPTDILRAEINTGYKNSAIVGYSKITQEEIGNGKTEKYYSNFNSYPDIYENIIPTPSTTAQINFFKFFRYPGVFIQRMDLRRGKLLKEIIYNNLNDTIKKSTFDYQYFEKNSFETTKKVFEHISTSANIFYAKNRFITYQNYLTKHTVEDLFNGKTVKSERIYTYDQPINLLKKQETISSGNSEETTYKYAIDQNQADLINANMISVPLLTESKKNGKTISKTETKYDTPYPSELFPGSIVSYNLQNNNAETEVSYDQYDTSGNLVQYTTKEGIPVTIVWGYNNSHPIAKIEGIDFPHAYSTVLVTAISKSNQDIDDSSEQDLIVALNNFRSNNLYKDYKITTYTYDPLIGIKSITPPSGIRENYLYDASNRLEKIVNMEGRTLKEFKYNYAATTYYNSERSGNFMKYCGGNGIGTAFTYTVAPNTYTSIISQADADQKAQNDVNSNGQNAANNNPNGICTPFSCNLSFNTSIGISGGGSVSVQSNGYYKASFGFSSGSNSTNLPWTTTGVKVATISGSCLPTTEYSGYNGQVYYTIKTNGDVILRSQSTAPGNNTSYNYEIIFPIN